MMIRFHANILVLFVLLGSVPSARAQVNGLELRLESTYTETLPGLPIPLRLVAVNSTSRELPLPSLVFVHAARGADETFVGSASTGWAPTPPIPDDGLVWEAPQKMSIAARATVVARLGVSHNCAEPSFLLDPFFFTTGRYTLRVVAAADMERLRDATLQGRLADVLQAFPDAVVSSAMTLDVRAPQPGDAEAWTHVLEITGGKGWLQEISLGRAALVAAQLRQRYPDSRYTLCFGATSLGPQDIPEIDRLAARARMMTPRPPMLDWLELQRAATHAYLCDKHLDEPRNVSAAIAECDAARTLYAQLSQTAEHPEVAATSAEGLEATMTADEIREFLQRLDAAARGTYQKVTPLLQCVKESGPRLEARFTYRNPNPFPVHIARGAMNFFTPEPGDRGQPTKFLPGVAESAVSVIVEAKKGDPATTISWTLDGSTVTAPSASAPRCKGR